MTRFLTSLGKGPAVCFASIVGLLIAAAQISQFVSNIIRRSRKAPKECHDLRLEVDTIRRILEQLQLLVSGALRASLTPLGRVRDRLAQAAHASNKEVLEKRGVTLEALEEVELYLSSLQEEMFEAA